MVEIVTISKDDKIAFEVTINNNTEYISVKEAEELAKQLKQQLVKILKVNPFDTEFAVVKEALRVLLYLYERTDYLSDLDDDDRDLYNDIYEKIRRLSQ